MLAGLEIETVESEQGIPVLHIRGEIDLHTCPQLRTALREQMDAGKYHLVLDLSEVPYLDSAALGVLVDAVRRAREQNGGLHLVQVTPFVQRAFEITRLIKIFHLHESLEAALVAISAEAAGDSGK